MVGHLGEVVSSFRPIFRIEGRGPHHHVEVARRWCSNSPPPGLSRIRASPVLLLPFSTSGPDLGAWPNCWISRGPTVGSPWSSSMSPSLGRGRVAPLPSPLPNLAFKFLHYVEKCVRSQSRELLSLATVNERYYTHDKTQKAFSLLFKDFNNLSYFWKQAKFNLNVTIFKCRIKLYYYMLKPEHNGTTLEQNRKRTNGDKTKHRHTCVCVCSTRLLPRDGRLLFQNRKQKRHP